MYAYDGYIQTGDRAVYIRTQVYRFYNLYPLNVVKLLKRKVDVLSILLRHTVCCKWRTLLGFYIYAINCMSHVDMVHVQLYVYTWCHYK